APTFDQHESNVITVESGDDMQGQFPVRAHTRNVDKCLLHKYTSRTHGFRDGTFTLGSCTG
ncbi:hypothetical protein BaRGS_00030741, partial [Batillaria attramentaria]